MKKEVKDTIIVQLGEMLKKYPHFYLVDVTGLNAEQTSDLRRKCFKSEIKMVVVKNKLLHKAMEAAETDYSELYGALKGNTALMFTQVANSPAKLLKDYLKAGVPAMKAAYAEEGFLVGADKLDELVAIKSKNELIADVVAMLQSPMQSVLGQLESGASTIHGVLETLAKKGE
jgi:large subunit ribosomal protein L10